MIYGLTVPQASCWQQRGKVTGIQEAEGGIWGGSVPGLKSHVS